MKCLEQSGANEHMRMPGLRGLEHVGFTVPNLVQAIDFFVDVIGCQLIYELGPFVSDDDWMARQLRVHPRTVMKKLAFLRCGHGSNFEIFEYDAPDQNRIQPKNSDIGGHHLAFYVDDFAPALDYLKSRDVLICGDPITRDAGPSAGQTWVYFLTPWGMQCELVSFPKGKGYELGAPVTLWHPADPGA